VWRRLLNTQSQEKGEGESGEKIKMINIYVIAIFGLLIPRRV
jgi:hypothetical protein